MPIDDSNKKFGEAFTPLETFKRMEDSRKRAEGMLQELYVAGDPLVKETLTYIIDALKHQEEALGLLSLQIARQGNALGSFTWRA